MNVRVEILNEIIKSYRRLKQGERESRLSVLELTLEFGRGSSGAEISGRPAYRSSGIGHLSSFFTYIEGRIMKNERDYKKGTGFLNTIAAREDAQTEIEGLRLDIFVAISGLAVIICSLATDMLGSLLEEMLDPAFYTILTAILIVVGASLTVLASWLECRLE